MTQKSENQKDHHLNLFILIAVILTIVSIIYPFVVNHFFDNWSGSGTFGDTYGALNAIFSGLAFAGVIVTILIQKRELQNQRIELQLQRSEMKETRKEFLTSRTTQLVYNQLDRFENSLKDLKIYYAGKEYTGHDAISYLDDNKNEVYEGTYNSDDEYKNDLKKALITTLKIYYHNKIHIEKFARNAYNSVEVLKRIIFKTDLELEELNDIKQLFFVNVGFINMGVIKRISEVARLEIDILQAKDYQANHLDVGQLMSANIFLEPIVEFQEIKLTHENFDKEKVKWKKNIGDLER